MLYAEEGYAGTSGNIVIQQIANGWHRRISNKCSTFKFP